MILPAVCLTLFGCIEDRYSSGIGGIGGEGGSKVAGGTDSAGDPGADPETNNGVGYGLTGSQRKNFAANMWGETGAANWQEVNPTFKFKRY